jgi:hypothetical protein
VSIRIGVVGFYVAAGGDPHADPTLGPFVAQQDAQVCVAAAQTRAETLGLAGEQSLGVIATTARYEQELPEGSLNPYFPRGLLDPHRLPAELVEYWVDAGDDVVRWVAYAQPTPTLLLGRGQFELGGRQVSVELVRDQVAAQDPLLAQGVAAWITGLPARGVRPDGTLRSLPLRANRLDVGTLVVQSSGGATSVHPVVYVRQLRDADDLYLLVQFRLSLDGEQRQCPQHEFVTVLDERPPPPADMEPSSVAGPAAAEVTASPLPTPAEPAPSQRTGDRGRGPSSGQLPLFAP